MPGAAGRFAAEFDAEYEREVEGRLSQVLRKTALEALGRIVLRTPVDTGRARGSWIVSVGTEDLSEPERLDPSGRAAIATGAATISGVQEPAVIYLQSNLPYIEALEGGHSQQAPAGMVALTVAEIESMFQRVE